MTCLFIRFLRCSKGWPARAKLLRLEEEQRAGVNFQIFLKPHASENTNNNKDTFRRLRRSFQVAEKNNGKGKATRKMKNDSAAQDEILLAALKLFTEKGYFNTSLTDIMKASGLKSTNSVYKHFKNKQAIAAVLYGNVLDSLNCSIDDIRRKNKKFSDQLREVTGLLFALTEEAPEVMKFLLLIQHQEFLPDEKRLQDSAPFVKLKKIIQAGIKSGEIKTIDAVRAYTYFFGVINNTLKMVLSGDLDKQAGVYQSEAWVTAWNCIARK